jgi:two-component system OmpR family response regulator
MTEPVRPHILLVDDDATLTEMLRDYLAGEGFLVDALDDGEAGVAAALSGRYDAVILDVMMPRLSGIEVLRRVRAGSSVPVIMLTAKGDDVDRVVGLELGADDYVPKPYYPRELVARLRAVLRRRPNPNEPAPERTGMASAMLLECGALRVDLPARRALYEGREIELTASEFNLLATLLQSGDSVASKDDLSLKALGKSRASYDRSVDVHVSNLRHKLAASGVDGIEIETVRGIGYRVRAISQAPR